ncbi:hypothetical protein [uncultured phage cr116_1]|uniref:Uncharacterized protein n=1 Tax=uncultured phage cr116_1 TaxID=2772073 RepID=A0A7M1RY41_9CAUD|nr:hypothetical protein KNV40_gp002 [uncultured phage cr116_1]QOR59327.1 hypothetical protein [uncultured phage cr116_1]DAK53146.1 MAG TPA: hypothetical protein [Crassvirales sp.]
MEETKMTVEQVKAAANEQISILYQKLQEANLANTFKRLDYLFKIVEGNFDEELKTKARVEIDHIVFGYPQEDKKEE